MITLIKKDQRLLSLRKEGHAYCRRQSVRVVIYTTQSEPELIESKNYQNYYRINLIN
jgi:hypothetical protein